MKFKSAYKKISPILPWEESIDSGFFAEEVSKKTWNHLCEQIANKIQKCHKEFQGSWQDEDIEILIEEIREMIQK